MCPAVSTVNTIPVDSSSAPVSHITMIKPAKTLSDLGVAKVQYINILSMLSCHGLWMWYRLLVFQEPALIA